MTDGPREWKARGHLPLHVVPHVNDGTKQAHAVAPLDTSTLGPVRLDPNSERERARVVREALRAVAMEETGKAHEHLWQAAALASDGTLTKLKRLLKH